ncbi:MAG: Uma2 family endonuclease [Cyanomargarita calcarea GSE-NOS-MK-12-04C]|jgi:Uma2 family endonuclease|uniref:Uma2 family endonuclease n=1 Tax=Cyanomargarita calcarea GSE-NOS-MK-12-04C TaxID=2839659 RepID=A0A951QIB9_9CYAN|nr:Uma2 family endonuclease [Cyanomargarita calcarea GSE-NOS-MK-12-04C]
MHTQAKYLNFTVDEYLNLESQSVIRYEYIAGQVYPMLGDSEKLKIITGNLLTRLRTHLNGTECRVCSSDIKLRIEPLDIFYYPELSVTCDTQDRDKLVKRRPRLIVEVLSPITERIDRNEKFMNYKQLESLQEYVLVSQSEMKVDIYRKYNKEHWFVENLKSEDILKLSSVGLKMAIAEIYEDIEL